MSINWKASRDEYKLLLPILALAVLAGCASLPEDSFHQQLEQRAQELTAKFNQLAATDYQVPAIRYFDEPCDTRDATESDVPVFLPSAGHAAPYVTDASRPGMRVLDALTANLDGVQPNVVLINENCAKLYPVDVITNALPHEMAHLFANQYYHGDQGHNGFWQRIAILLGVPRTDMNITEQDLRDGGH